MFDISFSKPPSRNPMIIHMVRNEDKISFFQGGHRSWKSWKSTVIFFCPGKILERCLNFSVFLEILEYLQYHLFCDLYRFKCQHRSFNSWKFENVYQEWSDWSSNYIYGKKVFSFVLYTDRNCRNDDYYWAFMVFFIIFYVLSDD